MEPKNIDGILALVNSLLTGHRLADAVDVLRQGLAEAPDNATLASSLAWIRATAPDAQLRNGPEAVALAEHACSLTGYEDSDKLDTLAAAYAEAGRFDDAIRVGQQLLKIPGTSEQADEVQGRLALYRTHRPYRSPW